MDVGNEYTRRDAGSSMGKVRASKRRPGVDGVWCEVTGTEQVDGDDKHIRYQFTTHCPSHSPSSVSRRYRDVRELHSALVKSDAAGSGDSAAEAGGEPSARHVPRAFRAFPHFRFPAALTRAPPRSGAPRTCSSPPSSTPCSRA